jgi:hypothetical protein
VLYLNHDFLLCLEISVAIAAIAAAGIASWFGFGTITRKYVTTLCRRITTRWLAVITLTTAGMHVAACARSALANIQSDLIAKLHRLERAAAVQGLAAIVAILAACDVGPLHIPEHIYAARSRRKTAGAGPHGLLNMLTGAIAAAFLITTCAYHFSYSFA